MEVDMLVLCLIIVLLLLFFITLLVFVWQSGMFFDIDIKTCPPPFKNIEIGYKYFKRQYKDIGALFTEVSSFYPDMRPLGIYFDNPVEERYRNRSIRYLVGVILNDAKHQKDSAKEALMRNGYKFMTLPDVEYMVHGAFPKVNSLSILMGTKRMFPALQTYIQEKKLNAYPILEIYDPDWISYYVPLSKQDEFFVPEFMAESDDELTSNPRTLESDDTSTHEDNPNTVSSVDSLPRSESKNEELPASVEFIKLVKTNGEEGSLKSESDASTESFEELQLDS